MTASEQWRDEAHIIPCVDGVREFIEIARDFTNPLDIVREAISNAYDASANSIEIHFWVAEESGERVLKIRLADDGDGMDQGDLQRFFDLGNSRRQQCRRTGRSPIGEKGHGTKVYFNSSRIEVTTFKNGRALRASLEKPLATLFSGRIPTAQVQSSAAEPGERGTEIIVTGYNNNRRELFTHSQLKDYILWFTKFGSFETQFPGRSAPEMGLELKGIDVDEARPVSFGHPFPPENRDVERLITDDIVAAPHLYVRKWIDTNRLPNYPEISYEAVFYVEGDAAKKNSNAMIRRQGVTPTAGMYRVQDRYGIWLAKDFIPVERKNEWITTKGSEYTRFHAFVNCQGLRLTANRGSAQNTPQEVLADLERVVEEMYRRITASSDWSDLDYLRQEATGYRNAERDERELKERVRCLKQKKVAVVDGVRLLEPRQEIGVYGLVMCLQAVRPKILPFEIVDYDSHVGVDALVKAADDVPIEQTVLKLVEFKRTLQKSLNHMFKGLHAIVCWDCAVRQGDEVKDVGGSGRVFHVVPEADGESNQYFLDDLRSARRIPVYVLSEYLPAHGISFLSQGNPTQDG